MKKVFMIIALLAGAVSFSNAQQGQGGGQGAGGFQMPAPAERAQRTIDGQALASFNLTADQKAKTLALLTKMHVSTDSLRATIPADGDRAAAMQTLMPKMAAISASTEATFIAILTPDQKKTYDAALTAAKERNPNATGILSRGMGGRGPGGQGGGQRPQGAPAPTGN